MIAKLAAQMLDPYFVREEELALLIDRKSSKQTAFRSRIIGDINTGELEIRVPTNHEWLVYSVMGFEPTDAGAGSLPKTYFLDLVNEQNDYLMRIGANDMPAIIAQSYITWGIDLPHSIYDNGQLPPSHFITAPLPKLVLPGDYGIRANRDGIGGAPITDARFTIFFLERY